MIEEKKNDEKFQIIDVRTSEEFQAGAMEGAININLYEPNFQEELKKLDKAKTYLIYCRSGSRSKVVLEVMEQLGFETVYELDAIMGAKSKTTWWEEYERIKKNVDFLIKNLEKNKPAMKPSVCKLCPWYGSCKRWCEENNDLSLIF